MQNAKGKVQKYMIPVRIAILHFAFCILHFAVVIDCSGVYAQDYPTWGQASPPQYRQPASLPDQPIIPNDPSFERRPARPDPDSMAPPLRGYNPPAGAQSQPGYQFPRLQTPGGPAIGARPQLPYPFKPPLTPQEEGDLDRLLMYWEQGSANVKTFECKLTLFAFDTFDPTGTRKPDEPKSEEHGEIKYSAPDKALFRIIGEEDAGEYWMCDGKAIYTKDAVRKQIKVQKLPPELQGKAIGDGPVPFLFGAKAVKLKQRYYMRIVTPEAKRREQVWLEAWPRYPADAKNFKYAELILSIGEKSLTPTDLRLHHPNGNQYFVYRLSSIAVNKSGGVLGGVFEDPWWRPRAPRGWQTVEEPPQVPQAPQPPMGRQTPPSVGTRFQDSR